MYFSLKDSKSKSSLIILRYHINKNEGRFVYSTGLKINPSDWNKADKMPNRTRGRTDLSIISRDLEKYSKLLDSTLLDLREKEIPITRQILKERFDGEFKEKTADYIYFTDWISDFVEIAHNIINRTTRRPYAKSKIKNYKKAGKRLQEFEKFRGKRIRLDGFTLKVYDEFIEYLYSLDYAVNTIGDFVKLIVPMLRKAAEDHKVCKDYELKEFAVLEEETIAVVLSEDEIQKIFDHDFSNSPMLENCRDIAIIGLWTGLRGGDFLNLPEINPESNFIEIQPSKTKETSRVKVVIPLHKHIKSILKQRGMPRMISDVKFNDYIKRVCKEVGIVEQVKGAIKVYNEDSKVWRKKAGLYPKYKLISSHTCRRSFATNLYKSNFPTLSIMQITGHRTEKNFLKYIKVTPTEHAQKLLDHWNSYYGEAKSD